MLDERRDIRAEEVLAVAEADHERRVEARADDDVGLARVNREQRERALEAGHDVAERLHEVTRLRVLAAEQLRGNLGVGLGEELDAVGLELFAQLVEVLDDAVVNDGELAAIRQVRVRIAVVRGAVRGPAGVADADVAICHGGLLEVIEQRLQLAGALAGVQRTVLVDHGDARRVVAAVFESGQTRQEDLLTGFVTDVSNDSTHRGNSAPSLRRARSSARTRRGRGPG